MRRWLFLVPMALAACRLSDRPAVEIVGCLEPYRDVAQTWSDVLAMDPQGDAALVVRVDGQTVCRLFFGDVQDTTKVYTVSAAKWLTAATVMAVVDEGKLSVMTRVSDFYPQTAAPKSEITVSQLLSHTSGLLWFSRCMGRNEYTLQSCAEQILDSDYHFEPGTGFFYSGPPFTVAGAMAELATGKPWSQLFREKIAEPLGMTSTSYGAKQNPALSEGDVKSTADDYAKFAQMLLDRGMYGGRRVLSESAVAQMRRNWTAGVQVVSSPNEDTPYGLGAWLDEVDDAGIGRVMSSPGVAGFIPIVDYGRNTVIVFTGHDERVWTSARTILAAVRAAVDRER
jgi:CubicO group peptidase (beta-lactamase class C family)